MFPIHFFPKIVYYIFIYSNKKGNRESPCLTRSHARVQISHPTMDLPSLSVPPHTHYPQSPFPPSLMCPSPQLQHTQHPDQRPCKLSEVQPQIQLETSCSTTGHTSQKTREKTETKQQNTHPTKTNSEMDRQTYKHPKPRCLEASVRTQSSTAKAIVTNRVQVSYHIRS